MKRYPGVQVLCMYSVTALIDVRKGLVAKLVNAYDAIQAIRASGYPPEKVIGVNLIGKTLQ